MTDIILITSVIYTGGAPYTYTSTRSVYSAEERFQQTLGTIESIRTYFPTAKILLVEASKLSEEHTKILVEKTDFYVNLYEDEYVRKGSFESNMKGYGEAIQTKFAIEYILKKKIQFNRFFKISGRYFLTEKFQAKTFSTSSFTFKRRLDTNDGSIIMSTILYSVPKLLFNKFYDVICFVIQYYETRGAISFEEIFPRFCEPREEIETIGAGGRIAVVKEEPIFV